MHVDHSKSQLSDYKLSLIGACSHSRDLFNFWKISGNISLERLKLNSSNFVHEYVALVFIERVFKCSFEPALSMVK